MIDLFPMIPAGSTIPPIPAKPVAPAVSAANPVGMGGKSASVHDSNTR
jgi:hypothetical protein